MKFDEIIGIYIAVATDKVFGAGYIFDVIFLNDSIVIDKEI